MPTSEELVAYGRSVDEVRELIGCDALIYQDIAPMLEAVARAALPGAPVINGFDASCFDGVYVTGDVSVEDISRLSQQRVGSEEDSADHSRLALPNANV
jgi:amidophosphoribosyltransferase